MRSRLPKTHQSFDLDQLLLIGFGDLRRCAALLLGIRRTGGEVLLMRPIRFGPLSNVFAETYQGFVRNGFFEWKRLALISAVLTHRRASPQRQFSKDLQGWKLSRRGGRLSTRKYAARSPVFPAKFQLIPSCACRLDTSAAQEWKTYASPYIGELIFTLARVGLSGAQLTE